MFLLDTSVCIRLLNRSHSRFVQQFQQFQPNDLALCSIVKAELLYGARHSQKVESNLQLLTKFFAPLASLVFYDRLRKTALVRADLATQGKPIGPNDLLIAVIARSNC